MALPSPIGLTRAGTKFVVCRSVEERARLLDINRRLLPYARFAIVLMLLAGVAGVRSYGWLPLTAMVISCVAHEAAQARIAHLRRPELALIAMVLAVQVILAGGIAFAYGPRLYLLSVLTFPLMFAAATFPARTVFLVTVWSLLLLLDIALGFDGASVTHLPPLLLCPAINLITLPLLMEAACDLDVESRGTVVVDRLTGLLNRAALSTHLAELSHQARTSGQPVAVLVGDLDRFKAVNDQYGHAAGDAALKEVAYCLRKNLGPFQAVYRLGGEEFLILLADADTASAVAVADRLREAVADARISPLQLTMSFGVAGSTSNEHFDFEAAFKRADTALYQAKHAGRNRVGVADGAPASDLSPAMVSPPSQASVPSVPLEGEIVALEASASAAISIEQLDHEEEQGLERSWLISDSVSRAHLLDLTQRLTRRTAGAYALGFASVLAAAPYYGWWILLPGFVTGTIFNVLIANLERFRRPEYALALGALLAQAGGGVGLLVGQGEILFDLPVLILLLVGVSVLLPARGVLIGVLFTAGVMAGVAFLHGAPQVIANPSLLALPVALAATVGLIGSGVGRSDTEHRSLAIVDPLTGMLNRAALETKIVAVTHAANLTGETVAVAVGDLDHFKAINDRYGHATGDATLGTVASCIRSQLRAFESAYRVGGEEFVVVLPGLDELAAAGVAERIRLAVSQLPNDGIPITMSLGVAASKPGEMFDYQSIFTLADRALYNAKGAGRNRVHPRGATRALAPSRPRVAV